eukprot:6188482-Pleurochrysis_carterae.AAC.1
MATTGSEAMQPHSEGITDQTCGHMGVSTACARVGEGAAHHSAGSMATAAEDWHASSGPVTAHTRASRRSHRERYVMIARRKEKRVVQCLVRAVVRLCAARCLSSVGVFS